MGRVSSQYVGVSAAAAWTRARAEGGGPRPLRPSAIPATLLVRHLPQPVPPSARQPRRPRPPAEAHVAAGESSPGIASSRTSTRSIRSRVYDGFLVHSRPGDGAAIRAARPPGSPRRPCRDRDDVGIPVLTFRPKPTSSRSPPSPRDNPTVRTSDGRSPALRTSTRTRDRRSRRSGPGDPRRPIARPWHRPRRHAYVRSSINADRSTTRSAPRYERSRGGSGGRPPASTEPLSVRPGDPPVIGTTGSAAPLAASARRRSTFRSRRSPASGSRRRPCTRFGSTTAFDRRHSAQSRRIIGRTSRRCAALRSAPCSAASCSRRMRPDPPCGRRSDVGR